MILSLTLSFYNHLVLGDNKSTMKDKKGRKKMKKILILGLVTVLGMTMLTACGKDENKESANKITVISREDGSGTRGAFVELFGIEEKDENGKKVDKTIATAEITNSTNVMMTTVAGNKSAIGYVSLGSLNDTVKAAKIDGAEATVENIKNGTYKISRPFNIVTKDEISEVAEDFINFIMSEEGQKVVEDKGYISEGNTGAFESTKVEGKIVIDGSTSVYPVMEKLVEAYKKVNENATIELQQSDSSTGVSGAIKGTFDIGMASRELKDSETGVNATAIAIDGIAVIVNKDAKVDSLTSEQVKSIYTGKIKEWSEIK